MHFCWPNSGCLSVADVAVWPAVGRITHCQLPQRFGEVLVRGWRNRDAKIHQWTGRHARGSRWGSETQNGRTRVWIGENWKLFELLPGFMSPTYCFRLCVVSMMVSIVRDVNETWGSETETRPRRLIFSPRPSHTLPRPRPSSFGSETRPETFPHFAETEIRPRCLKNTSRDRLETETLRPRLQLWVLLSFYIQSDSSLNTCWITFEIVFIHDSWSNTCCGSTIDDDCELWCAGCDDVAAKCRNKVNVNGFNCNKSTLSEDTDWGV